MTKNIENLANMVDGHINGVEKPVANEESMKAVRKLEAEKADEAPKPKKSRGRPKGSTKAKTVESKMNIAPEIDKNEAMAKMIVNTQSILYRAFTNEGLDENERYLSHKSFKDYLEATGGLELSPAHALLLTQGALALAKFKSAKEESKVGKIKTSIAKKIGFWFARRKVEKTEKAEQARKAKEEQDKQKAREKAKANGTTDLNVSDLIPSE